VDIDDCALLDSSAFVTLVRASLGFDLRVPTAQWRMSAMSARQAVCDLLCARLDQLANDHAGGSR